MAKRPKQRRSLDEMLQSTSDVLFPAKMGRHRVKLNSRDCEGDTPLHVMIWRDDNYAARVLIEEGARLNTVGDMGETPLHVALGKHNYEISELLIRKGARTDIRSEFGQTAAEIAMSLGGEYKRLLKR